MEAFVNSFLSNFGPQVSKQISKNIKVDRRSAQSIVAEITPLIMGGLKKQMQDQGGGDRVNHILNKYGDPSVLDHIDREVAARAQESRPDPRLGGLLGESGMEAVNQISNRFGLNMDTAMKLIPMISPLVLGALTRKRDQEGFGADGIASLIDRDGDGSVLDDVAGFFMQSMGNQSRRGGGSIMGKMLGSLFGGRSR